MTAPIWSAGATGINAVRTDGWFSFSVPIGVAGVAIGITKKDRSVSPYETTHGLHFASGKVSVWHQGAQSTSDTPHLSTDRFNIIRAGKRIFISKGIARGRDPAIPFRFPGTIFYRSNIDAFTEPMLLDAALLAPGDSVIDAAYFSLADSSGVDVDMKPMRVLAAGGPDAGWEDDYSTAAVLMEPLTVQAGEGNEARVSMRPMAVFGTDNTLPYAEAVLSMLPMTTDLFEVPSSLDGAFIDGPLMTIAGSGVGWENNGAILDMGRMGAFGTDHEDGWAQAVLRMRPLNAFGIFSPLVIGSEMHVVLPVLDGTLVEPPIETPADIVEVGYGSNEIEITWWHQITEVGRGSAPADAWSDYLVQLEDRGRGRDTVTVGSAIILEGVGIGTDEVSFGGPASISEVGLGSSEVIPSSAATTVMIEEVGKGRDFEMSNVADVTLEVDGLGSDEVIVGARLTLTEVGLGSDETDTAASSRKVLIVDELGVGLNELFAEAAAGMVLVDEVGVGIDDVLMRSQGLAAWVMNTESAAVSWYAGWPFTGIAELNGVVYAVGPDGLAVLGGAKDDGSAIPAVVDFGFTDFSGFDRDGMPRNNQFYKQRVEEFWVGYTADGVLEAQVQTYGSKPYKYRMEKWKAGTPVNNRIKPGKGLNERFWRIGLRNVAGCDFEINSITAMAVRSERRK
jgi:hypothetical protein